MEGSERTDRVLELSLRSWERVPKVAREIDSWDLLDQLVYTEEWPLEIDRLAQLED